MSNRKESAPQREQRLARERSAARIAAMGGVAPVAVPTASDIAHAAAVAERAAIEADPRYERNVEGSYGRCKLALSDSRLAAATTDAELCALICSLRAAEVAAA